MNVNIVTSIDVEQLAINIVESLNEYSDFEKLLWAVDNEASDWDFTKIILDWAKKQKKIAKRAGIEV